MDSLSISSRTSCLQLMVLCLTSFTLIAVIQLLFQDTYSPRSYKDFYNNYLGKYLQQPLNVLNTSKTTKTEGKSPEHEKAHYGSLVDCNNTWFKQPPERRETLTHIGKSMYVYSAYYDPRYDVVRVIGMSPRFKPQDIYCLLWYRGISQPLALLADIYLWNDERYELRAAMIRCHINGTGPHKVPHEVSFTQSKCGPQSNGTLRIDNLQTRQKKYNFVVCIHGALTNRYSNYNHLVEHVEVHRLFGADYYNLYNFSSGEALQPYLEYYIKQGQMEVHNWPCPPGYIIHNIGQIAIINDCLYRFMYKTKYLVLLDIDEFAVPRSHPTWDGMLYASKCYNESAAVIRNVYFGTANQSSAVQGRDVTTNKSRALHTLTKFDRTTPWPCGDRSKFMAIPEGIEHGTVHFVQKLAPNAHSCCMEPDLGLIHHYRFGAERNFYLQHRDKSLLKYENEIVSSVQHVLNNVQMNMTLH